MNITLIYATNSGGTFLAAEQIEKILTEKGHKVTVKNARDAAATDLDTGDLTILGSPSWLVDGMDGQPHDDMKHFMETAAGHNLEGKKMAVYGLGDSSYPNFCGAVRHMEEFVKAGKGTMVVNSLRIDGFFFNQEKGEAILKTWTENLATKLT